MELLAPSAFKVGCAPPAAPFPHPFLHTKGRGEGQTGEGDRGMKGMKEMRINPHRALAKAGQSPAPGSAGEQGWGSWLEMG